MMFWEGKSFLKSSSSIQANTDPGVQTIDLLHLVESNQEKVFSSLIAYYGSDKERHLKDSLRPEHASEYAISNRYYSTLEKILRDHHNVTSKSSTKYKECSLTVGDITEILNGSFKTYRVELKHCDIYNKSIGHIHHLDFVKGKEEFLLYDIDNLGLYTKAKGS